MKKNAISVISIILITLFLTSCTVSSDKYTAYSFDYFDTVTVITGYANSQEEFDKIKDEILYELKIYHQLYTIYDRYEDLNNLRTINTLTNGTHDKVSVDKKIIGMLLFSKDMHEMTNGAVNIAMGSVLSIWHDYRQEGITNPKEAKLPSKEELKAAAEHIDLKKLIINEEENSVYISDPNMKLDVGAVAKGYAVEMIAQLLESRGITGYVLNVGGNVRTVGSRADGTPWKVGIENPAQDPENPYIEILELSGQALVTSGSYQRYYTVNGKNYHHIIDPETLMPSESYVSISIVSSSSALADALSTALFTMDYEEGLALIESISNSEALWLFSNGEVKYSSGFAAYISN